jgi:SNF2 family DNA or RNA helicase
MSEDHYHVALPRKIAGYPERIAVKGPQPWKHQLDGVALAAEHEGSLLAFDMGTGKSRTFVDFITNLPVGENLPVLIVAPAQVVSVWPREFAKHCAFPERLLVRPLIGPRGGKVGVAKRAKMAQEILDLAQASGRRAVLVTNYESFASVKRSPALAAFCMRTKWAAVCLDEIHRIKRPGGSTSMFFRNLRSHAERRVGLTGTPMPHSPLDVYAQMRALDISVFGNNYAAFRAQYAVMHPIFPTQVLKWMNLEGLNRKFYSRAIRVERGEVLELPPWQHIAVPVILPDAARKAYDELKKETLLYVENGELTTQNALTLMLRLQQMACGHIQIDGEPSPRHLHSAKAEALEAILDGLPPSEPVVVFCRFHADLDAVHAVAEKVKRKSSELSGRRHGRRGVGSLWEDGPDTVAAIQIQSGGVGIDLTRAAHVVIYSTGFDMGQYEQALARTDRQGQERKGVYFHLLAENTVDVSVAKALAERKSLVESALASLGDEGEVDEIPF